MENNIKSNINNRFRLWGTIDTLYARGPEKIEEYCREINEKRFRVADTALSYRQINYLDSADILKDNRKSDKEWRKFNFKEIIFFALTQRLRQYGLNDDYLKKIGDCFFKKTNSQNSDFAVIMAMNGQHIVISQESNGDVYFSDTITDNLYNSKQSILLRINLNEIINEFFKKTGKRKQYKTYADIMSELAIDGMSEKEREIMELIRNKEYKTITIKKNDKEEFIVKGETAKTANEKDLITMLKEKDFADFIVVKRDGNIVNIKVEDNFKI